jgi:hypothetical protein
MRRTWSLHKSSHRLQYLTVNRSGRWLLAVLLCLCTGCAYYEGTNPTYFGAPLDERTGQPMEAVNPNDPAYRATWQHQHKFPGQPNPVVIPPE